jgi:hypothetical protein
VWLSNCFWRKHWRRIGCGPGHSMELPNLPRSYSSPSVSRFYRD